MLCACSSQLSADVGFEAVCFPEGEFSVQGELLLLPFTVGQVWLLNQECVLFEKLGEQAGAFRKGY